VVTDPVLDGVRVILADRIGTVQNHSSLVFAIGAAVETLDFGLRRGRGNDDEDSHHQTQAKH